MNREAWIAILAHLQPFWDSAVPLNDGEYPPEVIEAASEYCRDLAKFDIVYGLKLQEKERVLDAAECAFLDEGECDRNKAGLAAVKELRRIAKEEGFLTLLDGWRLVGMN